MDTASPSPSSVVVAGMSYPAVPPVVEAGGPRPFWSVVIPVHNRRRFLPQCLASVLDQFPGPERMEVLVADNGSDPPLEDVVAGLGRGIARCHRHADSLGLVPDWNRAVALSRGVWVHLLHDDDYVKPGFYAALERGLVPNDAKVGAAFTGYEVEDASGKVTFTQQVYGPRAGIPNDWPLVIGSGNCLQPPAVVVRRSTYEQLGGYRPDLAWTPDWEFYMRAACFVPWWYEPALLARYRQHRSSETGRLTGTSRKYRSLGEAIDIARRYLPAEVRDEAARRARRTYFRLCLAEATAAGAGQEDAALRILQEGLRLDSAPDALELLFRVLAGPGMDVLRRQIARLLVGVSDLAGWRDS